MQLEKFTATLKQHQIRNIETLKQNFIFDCDWNSYLDYWEFWALFYAKKFV